MRKIICLLLVILGIFSLIGCGKKVVKTTLSATITENTEQSGKINRTIEMQFVNDVASSAKETRKFSNKNLAEQYRDLLKDFNKDSKSVKISISGNTVTESYGKLPSTYKYYGMSREAVKNALENDGWKIK